MVAAPAVSPLRPGWAVDKTCVVRGRASVAPDEPQYPESLVLQGLYA